MLDLLSGLVYFSRAKDLKKIILERYGRIIQK